VEISALYEAFLRYPLAVTDSRAAVPGSLFFALKGARFDGNRFAAEALCKGSVMAVIDDPSYRKDERYVLVDNVLDSLQKLAVFHRKQMKARIIAVTGTNGKTTTKELIKACLSKRYHAAGTEGNLNNHIGVPLTLLRLKYNDETAVIEIGANHPQEITMLCNIADPDDGIITNIGRAHIEGFGSFEGVRKAKGELYDYLAGRRKTIFVNGNDPVLAQMAVSFPGNVFYYGDHRNTVVSGKVIKMDPFMSFDLFFPGKEILRVNTQITGRYNFDNFLAAACISTVFNVSQTDILQAFETYKPGNMRSQLLETQSNLVFLDSYNANPSSVGAAVASFVELPATCRVIILGEMLELGSHSVSEHKAILRLIDTCDVNHVFLVGPVFKKMKVSGKYSLFNDSDELAVYLREHPVAGSSILVKGSRLMALEKVVPFL